MVDVMSAERRSLLMSRIRDKDTSPEVKVRKLLWSAGLRYRLHTKGLPGKPDLVFRKWRAVVFVHGCFWHRHSDCPFFRLPKTRTSFWDEKLRRNQERDAATVASLATAGWRVAVVWECGVRLDAQAVAQDLAAWIRQGTGCIELAAQTGSVQCSRLLPTPPPP
ncbi:very short patch repair endonuclease [Luteimonas sp. MJ174]|uniref:very short patch repair endonuclease n=1 Tax=Luteimonas sp. MJ174 TaxID=3129237 RepID=UPI0031BAE99A